MTQTRRSFLLATMGAVGAAGLHGLPGLASVPAAEMARDPRRPQYHLLPAANWMNDPNGPIYWHGRYHMFYQYNPNGAFWGDMHWAHAVSTDMVHWRHLPVALAPTPGGPDAAGVFSGTAVVDQGRVKMIYTGVVKASEVDATIRDGVNSLRESQCLATGSGPDLTVWTKAAKPIIAAPPAGLDVAGFRDPSPWRKDGVWYMAVGSGVRGKGGAILLYRSHDLEHWEYLHLLAGGESTGASAVNPVDSGDMWECPDFFPLDGKHVLIHSTQGKAYWQSGTFDEAALVFHAERGGVLDHGSFYAPKTQLDRAGNRILWGWIPETRPLEQYRASGWAGMMSLPRALWLDSNGDLRIGTPEAVKSLSRDVQTLTASLAEADLQKRLTQMRIPDACGRIDCALRKGKSAATLTVRAEGGSALLVCRYDPARPGEIKVADTAIPVSPAGDGQIEMRMFLDGSVIELIVDERQALTKRFYYEGTQAPAIGVEFEGDTAGLAAMSMSQMTPISADRLTT